jgi:hypothetical protein
VTLSIAVVCEAPPDQRTGCDLADRVVCDEVEWIEPDLLDHLRQWRGRETGETCLMWRTVARLASTVMIPLQSFGGEPAAPDAHAARKAIWLLHHAADRPDAVVLLRDDDGQTDRRAGLEQARRFTRFSTPIIIGVARVKRECWVLAGFDPKDDDERSRLEGLRNELGFDPREHSERLTAKHEQDKRSAKRVLRVLVGDEPRREEECWQTANLEALTNRGQGCGLSAYLDEVRQRLVPEFTRRR